MDFKVLKFAVAKQFNDMSKYSLFYTSVDKEVLWQRYLSSFPQGSNEIFRTRTHHDCSCCRQFVKTVGNVVAIIDNKIVSVWDGKVNDPDYAVVSDSMAEFVKLHPIENIFLSKEKNVGTDKNFEEILGVVKTWNHFFANIPSNFVCTGDNIGPRKSEAKSSRDVFARSLTEISNEAIDTVLELISQNSLYRGQEHKFAIETFKKIKKEYNKITGNDKEFFFWQNLNLPHAVLRIKNTAIGTLLMDISEGYDLEDAVKSFESKVAPTNYKRPTALVTKSMVESAKKKIAELGLTSALERRYASIEDIGINDIIFANREARKIIEGDVFDQIATKSTKIKKFDKVEEVSIEKFLEDVVSKADSIEIMFDASNTGNLVSLIAPNDPNSLGLFKWNNKFSWSYNGDVTDSIKERVKQAGGNVVGDLCCRLAWYNHDDLDLHLIEPPRGQEISFANRKSLNGGELDVDMNAGALTNSPVENIFYRNRRSMLEGEYNLFVHNFRKRQTKDVGFEVEIDYLGNVLHFKYDKAVTDQSRVNVAKFSYTHKDGFAIINSLPSASVSKEVWGIKTNEFHKVNVLMKSPNHWDGELGVGNKHYFFMVDGCKNDEQARGFYNEFLKDDLTPHRKVIEMVGNKLKTDNSDNQLSGFGFSSTQKKEVLVKVNGNFSRMLKVVI